MPMCEALKRCSLLRRVGIALATLLLALASAPAGFAQSGAQPPSTKEFQNWRNGMAKTLPPTPGCFTLTFPNTQWQQTPCKPAPKNPFILAHGPRPFTVGNGSDVAVGVSSGTISLAVGSFDAVSDVTSITDAAEYGSNDYSLQLNTNLFTTPQCSGAADPSQCNGWVQFLYSQGQCSGPCAFFEYSLINWGSSNCPAGWGEYYVGEYVCYFNTSGVAPSTTPAVSDFGNLSLVAEAQSGGNDTVIFSSGSALYAVTNPDSQLSLAQGWNSFEYNVVGDCCGSETTFNSGAALTVRASVENGTTGAPPCVSSSFTGYTGETNSLSFASAPTGILGTTPAIMFSETSSGTVSSPCSSATAIASGWLTDTHDFNADGKSDILWHNSSGAVAMWLMNGASVAQSSGVGSAATSWSIVGQRDFNGDGKADLLWYNTSSGAVAIWFMDGATVLQSSGVGSASGWTVAGTGDFFGTGMGDILWINSSGDVAIWEMNGTTVVKSCGVGSAPGWSVAGVGDFNGNGKDDILWYNTSIGGVAIWFMNGCTVTQSSGVGVAASPWTIAGTGDFKGSGMSDILWYNTSTGGVAIWFMNGATVTQSSGVGTVPTSWSVAETGDFYGAGTSDILWYNSSGAVAVWEMNGATVTQSQGIGSVPTSWSIPGGGD